MSASPLSRYFLRLTAVSSLLLACPACENKQKLEAEITTLMEERRGLQAEHEALTGACSSLEQKISRLRNELHGENKESLEKLRDEAQSKLDEAEVQRQAIEETVTSLRKSLADYQAAYLQP